MWKASRKFERRKTRARQRVRKAAGGRPRLSVFRSSKHIYAQIIDDKKGHTLVAASSMDDAIKGDAPKGTNKGAAEAVGKLIARRALEKGVKEVVFDRGAYLYHGRIKALADGARAGGLSF
jgi:large subunit ribosomal protein L18